MNTLVTHVSADLDSVASCWLIQKYLPGWQKADLIFIPQQTIVENHPVDAEKNFIYVDTGMGKFDHHQYAKRLSATEVVFKYLCQEELIDKKDLSALERMVEFVTAIDNFNEVYFPEPTADVYDFTLYQLIDGLKVRLKDDLKVTMAIYPFLEAALLIMKNKIRAEKEIDKGLIFTSVWGKTLAIESSNEEVMKLAQKKGITCVIRRDPVRKFIRIKTIPTRKYDLTPLYNKLVKIDPKATWFLHMSKNMLLNGSSTNPKAIPTSLTLQKMIEIVKGI